MSEPANPIEPPKRDYLTLALALFITGLFATAFVGALAMPRGAQLMPLVICTLGLVFSLLGLVRLVWPQHPGPEASAGSDMGEGTDVEPLQALRYGGWMVAYVAGLWLFGLIASTVVFTVLFLRAERRAPILTIIFVGGLTLATAMVLGSLLSIRWPAGILIP